MARKKTDREKWDRRDRKLRKRRHGMREDGRSVRELFRIQLEKERRAVQIAASISSTIPEPKEDEE